MDFIGNKVDYINFIIQNEADIQKNNFFKSLDNFDKTICQDFRIGGADCSYVGNITQDTSINDCRISDYYSNGGNCVKQSSAMFIHCSDFKYNLKIGKLVSPTVGTFNK